ncbi:hypothetical protein TNCV_2830991 [Trichonephila clavipes]|nr:hypothetical protein TNCV_2830991 [Trichonephila clavipes]
MVKPHASLESRNRIVCRTTSVCTNSSSTFEAAWTLTSETMAAVILDDASKIGASSMVRTTMNLGARIARHHFCQMNPSSDYSIKMVATVFGGFMSRDHLSLPPTALGRQDDEEVTSGVRLLQYIPGSWYLFLGRHRVGGYQLIAGNFDNQFLPRGWLLSSDNVNLY